MGLNGNGQLNNPYWASWVWDAAEDARTYELVRRYTRRPAEALYDLVRDPYELNNLIEDPGLVDVRKRLRESLDQWMHAQQDPGSEQDTWLSLEASRLGQHRFGPPAVKLSK
jgi:uncharacterized sulfatase